jgi:AcrR family transcriptional regulator
MSQTTRTGRPPVAEISELRSRALDVLLRHGYRSTTMGRVAAEVGVSVRTLHRYFPAKADIVWGGIEGSLDALRSGFADADEHVPIIDAISAVMVAVFDQDADEITVGRTRLRLIATTPELQQTRPETFRLWREETVRFIARRLGASPDEVIPRAVGAAVQTVISEALAWWAIHPSTMTPVEAVTGALHGLRIVTSSQSPPKLRPTSGV